MEYTRITLRIPTDLHGKLSNKAHASSKSMNAEVICRLRNSLKPKPQGMERLQVELASLADVRRAIGEELRDTISKELQRFNRQKNTQ